MGRRHLLERLRASLDAGRDDLAEVPACPPPEVVPPDLAVQQPVPLGHCSHVTGAGDWFTHTVSGVPLLVIRDRDSAALGGFLNLCLHEGNRVVSGDRGRAASELTCGFHGWRYDTRGRLAGAPGPDDLPDAEMGLLTVHVVEAHGLVIALPASPGVVDVETWLGPFAPDIEELQLARCRVARVIERNCHAAFASVAAVLVDPAGLMDWPDPRLVLEAGRAGAHVRWAAAPADTPPDRVDTVAVCGWFLFPSTLVLARREQVSVISVFPRDPGLVGWRHEVLAGAAEPPDLGFALELERGLFGAGTARAHARAGAGTAWVNARLADAAATLRRA
jgi:hypothetical protein